MSDVNQLFVQSEEIEKSKKMVDPKVLSSLKSAIKRIKDYHKRQIPKNDFFRDKHGVLLGGLWNPIESVGLYVPGGTAAYPSSLIMNAVPAIVAGVRRIVITVPAINGILKPSNFSLRKFTWYKRNLQNWWCTSCSCTRYWNKKNKKSR